VRQDHLEARVKKLLAVLASLMLLTTIAGTAVAKQPNALKYRSYSDNLPGRLAKSQNALRQAALEKVLDGKATAKGANKVVKVKGAATAKAADDIFVELAFEGEDQILTLLGEFGEDPATHDHGAAGVINHGGDPGPLHNEIPQPDRLGVDNTTIWEPDFSPEYYDRLLYDQDAEPSMANWYLEQSSGRYTVDGAVSDWVQLPNNESAYGSNYCGAIICTRDIGRFVEDLSDNWWDELVADQGSEEAASDWLAQFDVWDRYDWDLDGDFNEPDGYIDHFQAVHAGEGEETGGGAQGEDAIWSHRSYVNSVPIGSDGPDGFAPFGGAQIGDSNFWIGDYTVEPENGGVGVFAHEFGHDLNLPDEYDTSGNTGGAENGTGWWTPWSQGSYGTVSQDLGSYPVDSTAWEKLQLGWLNYDVAFSNRDNQRFTLGPSESNSTVAQALVVMLPDRKVTTEVGDPFAGTWFYNSDNGNDLDNTMTRQVTLPAGTVDMSFKAKYHIEPCWDYAYLQVSTNGTDFENVHTSKSTDDNTNGQNFGEGITGISGTPLACDDDLSPTPDWVNVTADLSDWAGQQVWIRFRYWTDGATVGEGISIDNIAITGLTTDGAETDPGWDYDGFFRTNGTVTTAHARYYIAEYRTYMGYDRALRKGPYNFTDPTNPDAKWVQHFPYQDGLLIWLWDTAEDDNNVGDHPGRGLILPIDSHFKTFNWKSGDVARPRLQSYDATFTLDPTKELSLFNVGDKLLVPSHKAKSVFDDSIRYWTKDDPGDAPGDGRYQAAWNSVKNPHTGTIIKILRIYHNDELMDIRVN
jgi:immune inhibitor A